MKAFCKYSVKEYRNSKNNEKTSDVKKNRHVPGSVSHWQKLHIGVHLYSTVCQQFLNNNKQKIRDEKFSILIGFLCIHLFAHLRCYLKTAYNDNKQVIPRFVTFCQQALGHVTKGATAVSEGHRFLTLP